MNSKNNNSDLIQKILLGSAITGFIILWLMFGGSIRYRNKTVASDLSRLYPLVIGIALILPYFFFLFKSKNLQKRVLNKNSKDLDKIRPTTFEYLDKKCRKNIFEIYVKNETAETLIINRESLFEPKSWHIFTTEKNRPIYFSNGINFQINEELNLEIVDYRNQIIGLGDEYFQKNDVPEYVNWAFIIAEPNQGNKTE